MSPNDQQDDKIEDMEPVSSVGSEDAAQATAQGPEGADSSPAQTDETETSDLLSVVRDVVDKHKAPEEAASSAEGSEDDGQEADEEAPKQDDENYSDVPFHKHPRFQQVLQRAKAYEADATRYRNVQGFLDSHGLAAEEAADALTAAGLAKTNPQAAWQQIKPWVQNLLLAAGEVLPEDLRQRVEGGQMPLEAAMEVSRARAQTGAVQAQTTFAAQQAERRQLQDHATGLVSAATDWESHRRARDPNFEAKLPDIQREIAWMHASEGKPNTPEGVKEQLKRAYQAANAKFRPAAPPIERRPMPTRPVTGGQVSGSTRAPTPKDASTMDIIGSVLAKHGAR